MEDAKQMTEDQIKLLQEKMKQMSPAELAEFQKQFGYGLEEIIRYDSVGLGAQTPPEDRHTL